MTAPQLTHGRFFFEGGGGGLYFLHVGLHSIQFNLFNKQMPEVSRDLWVMNMNKNKHIYKTTFT